MPNTNKIVLVVDDDIQAANNVRKLVNSVGIKCLTASGGYEGLNALIENKDQVSVVVLDLMMPGIDGIEFLKAVKNSPEKYGSVNVIILTNMSSNAVIQEAFNAGACAYLLKDEIEKESLTKEICKYFDT
jgi:two-component system response regulator HydG